MESEEQLSPLAAYGARMECLAEAAKPFEDGDVEWRALSSGISNGEPWVLVVAYATNRVIQQRLDDLTGLKLGYRVRLGALDGPAVRWTGGRLSAEVPYGLGTAATSVLSELAAGEATSAD